MASFLNAEGLTTLWNRIKTYIGSYHDSTKQDTISDLSTIRNGASLGATSVQPSSLSTVATSGSYNDLSNKPTIPTTTSQLTNNSDFASVVRVTSSAPTGGFLPNVAYDLGSVSGSVSWSLATASDATRYNEWMIAFDTGSTAPTIIWPTGITSWAGGNAPTISANKHYEVSVVDGYGICVEF